MRTTRNVQWATLGCGLLVGCVSSSIASDVEHVHGLSHADAMAQVDGDVEPATRDDVRRMLQQPLDADAMVRIALLNNRDLRASLRELGIARGELIQAGLLPNPNAEVELSPERNTQIEMRAELDLTHALLAPMRAHAAVPHLEAERFRVAGLAVELGYRVRVAFYRLDAAQQRLTVARQVLEGFAASRDAAQAMFDAGNLREIDLVNELAAYERAQITVAQLELDVLLEREQTQPLLGLYGTEAAWRTVTEKTVVADRAIATNDVEKKAMRASLELSELRSRLEGLARRAGVTELAGWLPDLSVDVHALHGNPEDPDTTGRDPELRWGGGVSASVPLFDRQQGTVTALEAERDALLERYYGTAIEIRSAARQARGRVQSAHQRARQYQEVIVPAQHRVTQQTLLQYNAMQVGVFQVLQARREELDAQLAALDTVREYQSAVAELDALLAGRRVSAEMRASDTSMSTARGADGGH